MNAPTPSAPIRSTWKYFGDLRTGMLGVWIGAIQNMYPELGAGVEDHSILLREPLQRVARSVFPIMGVVYDGDRAAQTGAQIRGYHETIKGVDATGPALSRAQPGDVLLGARHVLHVDPQDRRVLLRRPDRGREASTVRRARAVVPDVRHEHAARTRDVGGLLRVLGAHLPRRTRDQPGHARHLHDPHPEAVVRADADPDMGSVLQAAWSRDSAGSRPGCSTPRFARRPACAGPPGDEVLLRLFGKFVEVAFLAVPDEIRLHPRAVAAYRRAAGRMPADAPLVEAPSFTAPPRERRELPMHYVPRHKSLVERAGSLVHTTFSLAGLRRSARRGRKPGKAA